MKKPKFQIKEHPNRSGSVSYQVSGTNKDGERVRKNFRTHDLAMGFKQELELKAINQEPTATLKQTRMSDGQLKDAETALHLLGDGATLTEAVSYFKEHYTAPDTNKLLGEAFEEFIEMKADPNRKKPRAKKTIINLRSRVGQLVRLFPKKPVAEVSKTDIESVLTGKAYNQWNDYRALRNFLGWCVRKGYAGKNPCDEFKSEDDDDENEFTAPEMEPEALSMSQIVSLLESANDSPVQNYVALGLFGCLRPDETKALNRSKINLKTRRIRVDADTSKKREKRSVEMPDNLLAWLDLSKPICPDGFRYKWEKIRKRVGLFGRENWVIDYLRHTALTYHLEKHRSRKDTALWGGTSEEMLKCTSYDLN